MGRFLAEVHRIGRVALVALLTLLCALSAFSAWVAISTRADAREVRDATQLSAAWNRALQDLNDQEILEAHYRVDGDPNALPDFDVAVAGFQETLGWISANGEVMDRELARQVSEIYAEYLAATRDLFVAVGEGDFPLASALHDTRTGPAFDQAQRLVEDAVSARIAAAAEATRHLERHTDLVLWLTPVALGLALAAMLVIWSTIGRMSRRVADARHQGQQAEIARITAAAVAREEAIRANESHFRVLAQHGTDIYTIVAADGTILFHHVPVVGPIRLESRPEVGRLVTDVPIPSDASVLRMMIDECLRDPEAIVTREIRVRDGARHLRTFEMVAHRLRPELGLAGDVILTSREVTERRALEEQLRHQAFHDPLTGLANRALLMDRLGLAFTRLHLSGTPLAVLFMDLDEFKTVNDRMGHQAGDALLTAVGDRLITVVGPEQTVARMGGDEFTVLLEGVGVEGPEGASAVAERIEAAFEVPFQVDGHRITVEISIGIAAPLAGGAQADELLRSADLAMYSIKEGSEHRVAVYDPAMSERAWERRELESDLRRATECDEFRLYYQPIVDLRTGRLDGLEALIRWEHPVRGLLMPEAFIPFAERTGLVLPIGRWVLGEACRQVRAWQLAGLGPEGLGVSINISARQFHYTGLVEDVRTVLAETGLPASSLTLEVTESVMIQDEADAIVLLGQLRDLGVRIAIDDFGTGYSSLSYLERFPIDTLKIDRSFIQRIAEPTDGLEIVRMIVDLARRLGLQVIGEGIEEPAQLDQLRELRADLGQGFLFSRPLTVQGAEAFLREAPPVLDRPVLRDQTPSGIGGPPAAGSSHEDVALDAPRRV